MLYGLKLLSGGERERKPKMRWARGQGITEFALTLPLLLVLLLGIIEFGRMMFVYSSVVTAAREAARYGAAAGISEAGVAYYQDCFGVRDAAVRIGSFAGVENTAASVDIQYDRGPSLLHPDTISAGCPVGGTGPKLSRGDRIVVTVSVEFAPTQGLLPIEPFPVTSVVRRTVLVDVPVR